MNVCCDIWGACRSVGRTYCTLYEYNGGGFEYMLPKTLLCTWCREYMEPTTAGLTVERLAVVGLEKELCIVLLVAVWGLVLSSEAYGDSCGVGAKSFGNLCITKLSAALLLQVLPDLK